DLSDLPVRRLCYREPQVSVWSLGDALLSKRQASDGRPTRRKLSDRATRRHAADFGEHPLGDPYVAVRAGCHALRSGAGRGNRELGHTLRAAGRRPATKDRDQEGRPGRCRDFPHRAFALLQEEERKRTVLFPSAKKEFGGASLPSI